MKAEIKIPTMGESVSEAGIGAILKPDGSQVQENDEIIELETEKVNQVLYAPKTGTIFWKVKGGEIVKIGDVIGYVDTEAVATTKTPPPEAAPKAPKKEEKPKPSPAPVAKPKETPQETPKEHPDGARKMTPSFLSDLKGDKKEEKSAPRGRVEEEKRVTRKPLSKIRKVIAHRLVDALHTAAMLTTFNEADMTNVQNLRTKYKDIYEKKYGVKLGFMSFFVKAVVDALKSVPHLNSSIDKDEIVMRHYYDIGIAVGSERGLVVPVVRNCDRLSFAEIEKEIVQYAKKAREGGLTIADLEGGCFTITNGGIYGSLLSTPILNPPQSGILGMHKIMNRPVVEKDQIVIRPMMYLALSYDHRIVDGKEAVSFLVHVKEVLEDPSRLMFFEE